MDTYCHIHMSSILQILEAGGITPSFNMLLPIECSNGSEQNTIAKGSSKRCEPINNELLDIFLISISFYLTTSCWYAK